MADGLNTVRAMRVAEIANDYRTIQGYIAQIRANPSAEEYNEECYVMLRACVAQAQQLLAQPFSPQPGSGSDEEVMANLKRIIMDVSVRRFKAQRIYLRATAALRAINARAQLLQGQRPHAGQAAALQQIRARLRAEIAAITDARVYTSLRSADESQGRWLNEDPPLEFIIRYGNTPSGR